jgi:hypothetical protein
MVKIMSFLDSTDFNNYETELFTNKDGYLVFLSGDAVCALSRTDPPQYFGKIPENEPLKPAGKFVLAA